MRRILIKEVNTTRRGDLLVNDAATAAQDGNITTVDLDGMGMKKR